MENHTNGLSAALQLMEAQRNKIIAEIRSDVAAARVPLPQELVERFSHLNPHAVREILMEHPGYPSWDALGSYKISMSVFHKAFDDLTGVIDRFEVLAREGKIFGRSNEEIYNDIEIATQKELFAAVNAAHSLQDHSTRRLQKRISIDGYRENMQKHFSDDGLHDFVVGLRKIIHHLRMQPANWTVTKNVRASPEIQAEFQLDKNELMLFSRELNVDARSYLEKVPEKINVRGLFAEYRKRADGFHSWLSIAVERAQLADLRDYERCLSESKKIASRTLWKAMIGNWVNADTPPNPYVYFDRYLTNDQIDVVSRYSAGSKEQVDKIIEFVDIHAACDEELRGLVHKLFEKATE